MSQIISEYIFMNGVSNSELTEPKAIFLDGPSVRTMGVHFAHKLDLMDGLHVKPL